MEAKKVCAFVVLLCFLLASSGCGKEASTRLDNSESSETEVELTTSEVQSEQSEEAIESEINIESTQNKQETTSENTIETQETLEAADSNPSSEDILSYISKGESKLYWCAETPTYSDTMQIYSVTETDIEDFASQLTTQLGDEYTVSVGDTADTVEIIPNTSNASGMETILSMLTQITGTGYSSIESEEVLDGTYAAEYALEMDGYCVDSDGFSYDDGDGSITYICVDDNGKVSVINPLVLDGEAEDIDTAQFVSLETVKTICQSYYENWGIPSVTVVTDITLEYYYSSAEGKLLPAWRCETVQYMSEVGHSDSVLLDAQTGELLRK